MKALVRAFFSLIGIAIFLGFLWFLFVVPFVGWHLNTGHGQHTGYITAIEQNGIIFKTWTAFVKTDTQSSQEDKYCVVDATVIDALAKASDAKQHVTISYFSWFASGIANCDWEDTVISGVVNAPN